MAPLVGYANPGKTPLEGRMCGTQQKAKAVMSDGKRTAGK